MSMVRISTIILGLILVVALGNVTAGSRDIAYQPIILNSKYEVVRVYVPYELTDNMLIYGDLLMDINDYGVEQRIIATSEHKTLLKLIEEDPMFYEPLYNNIMKEALRVSRNMVVYWVTLDSFYAEVMNSDEDEALEEVLRLAGYLWSMLRSNKIHVDRVRVYYLQIPMDPYIPREMELYYADKYFELEDNGSIPDYVFMFGFLYGRDAMIPQFGGWLSCEFNDTKVLYTRQEVLTGIRSLADRIFGVGSPIVVSVTSECPKITPLPGKLYNNEEMDSQATTSTASDDGDTQPMAKDDSDVEHVDTGLEIGGIFESYLLSFLAAVAIVSVTTFMLLGRRLGG